MDKEEQKDITFRLGRFALILVMGGWCMSTGQTHGIIIGLLIIYIGVSNYKR